MIGQDFALVLLNIGSIDGVWEGCFPVDDGLKSLSDGRHASPTIPVRLPAKRFRIADVRFRAMRFFMKQNARSIAMRVELRESSRPL
ncbi:hypothetical protein [Burkholderia cepacia]|uniref:hypothetical protein n=1 Tax=Burkholderia cepacia TaxID=292 RepID=UPI002AB675FE|nr:hypothetical protein [Burkholderia cepacia]